MPEPEITETTLATLPLRALVAFAARCARRVLPLYEISPRHSESDATLNHLTGALEQAETYYAGGGWLGSKVLPSSSVTIGFQPGAEGGVRGAIASTVAAAYATALTASLVEGSGFVKIAGDETIQLLDADRRTRTARAAAYTFRAATRACGADWSAQVDAAASDYSLLREAALRDNWTDDTPVSPGFFGPLWPDGEPEWPQLLASAGKENVFHADAASPPVLAIAWDPRFVSAKEFAQLVDALGDLVRAEGGAGLKRLKSQTFGAPARKGVPS